MKDWKSIDDARLLTLLRKGWTRQQMADDFGVTRNSICGRLHRLICKQNPATPMEIEDDPIRSDKQPVMPELPKLPAPGFYVSTSADYLDKWTMKQSGHPYKRKSVSIGDLVSMIGLSATTCGRLIAGDEAKNVAMVEWYQAVDPKIWGQRYLPCFCRWTDLSPATVSNKRGARQFACAPL